MFRTSCILVALLFCANAFAQNSCEVIKGASLVAHDGTFLGRLVNKAQADSILNPFGPYGGEHGTQSIWNDYGAYGSTYSMLSAFNPYTSTPPVLFKDGVNLTRVSVNKSLGNVLDPQALKKCSF